MPAATNVKVGITVTVFFIILTAVVIWFSQYNPTKSSYSLQGNFKNVGGMVEGSKVYLMGVSIGKVKALIPNRNRVKVMLDIDSTLQIPTNSVMSITSKGLVGDKSVEFMIVSDETPKAYFKPGDIIEGNSPANFEDVIIEARKTLQKTQALIGDPEMNKNIRLSTKNIEAFTRELNLVIKQVNGVSGNIKGFVTNTNHTVDEINNFVGDLRELANSNRGNVNNIIGNANSISKSLDKLAYNLNDFMSSPDNKKDVKLTMKSIKNAADDIGHITANTSLITKDIHDVTGNLELKNNLKEIVNNTKLISGTFANTLSSQDKNKDKDKEKDKKNSLNVEFRSEILGKVNYQFNSNKAITFDVIGNFNILAHTGFPTFPFIMLGVEEIGSANQFNLQAGFYPFENLRVRLGLVRGKLGVGSNYFIKPTNTEIIAETYDISSPHVRLGALQKIYNDFGLSLYWDNHFVTNDNEFILGVRWQPSIF